MDNGYCIKHCEIGCKKSKEFLDKNNSAYDAAIDFWAFTEKCFENCPYKDKHTKEKKQ